MAPGFDLAAFTARLGVAFCSLVVLWPLFLLLYLRALLYLRLRRLRGTLGDREPRRAERTAQQWLRQLIPGQADCYAKHGFVEIDSPLIPGRRYRIHRTRRTEIHHRGAPYGLGCLQLRNGWIPPTDRVIAEYFLIQGDERAYLETVNIFRPVPAAARQRNRRRRLLFATMTSKQYCSLLVRFGIGQGLLAAMFAAVQVKLSSVRPRPTFIWIKRLPWQNYGPVIAGGDWVAILVNTFLVACFVAAIVRGGCEAWLRTSDRLWRALCLLEIFVVVYAVPYLTVQHHAAFVWCWY